MANFNQVTVVGNLTRDPELRYTPGGAAVCEVSIAINRSYTSKQTGQKVEEVDFFDCVLWGRTAEVAAQYLKKGKAVLFSGRLKQDRWDDATTGQKRSKVRIVVETMQFLGSKDGAGGPAAPDTSSEQGAPAGAGDPEADVPF